MSQSLLSTTSVPAPRYRVLLIGIDRYQGIRSLQGCVNDIDAMQDVLISRLGVRPADILRFTAPLSEAEDETTPQPVAAPVPAADPTLVNLREALRTPPPCHRGTEQREPTLVNLREALRRLGDPADPDPVRDGDRVFIYFSGHGTQLELPGQSGKRFVREALLPTDYKIRDHERGGHQRQYLFDWELNALLARIAALTPAISIVLDCCCAAGATRAPEQADAADRYVAADPEDQTPIVLPPGLPVPAMRGARSLAASIAGSLESCMVVAACLDDERARESAPSGSRRHGELTRALLAALAPVDDAELPELRWTRIWHSVLSAVERTNPAQHPWVSSSLARQVFGGPPVDSDPGYALGEHAGLYLIHAGARAGLTEGAEVAVYPATPLRFPPLGSQEERAARVALLRVVRAEPSRAEAERIWPSSLPALPSGARGRLIRAGAAARLPISVSPPDPLLIARLVASPLVTAALPDTPTEVGFVLRSDDQWALTDSYFGVGLRAGEPVLPLTPRAEYDRSVRLAERYFLYSAPLRFAQACTDVPHALQLTLLDGNHAPARLDDVAAQDPHLPEATRDQSGTYQLRAGLLTDNEGDRYCIRIDNRSSENLHVTLFNCESDGCVVAIEERRNIRARGHAVIWWNGRLGSWFRAALSQREHIGLDRFVAIGTTDRRADLRFLQVLTGFMEPGVVTKADPDPSLASWTAAILNVRLVRS